MKIKDIFKRLLFVLMIPITFILTGFQIIGLFAIAAIIWVIKGKQDMLFKDGILLIEKAFKLIEKDENN